jgi:integrase
VCPSTKRRLDVHDQKTKGLLLEVRPTGGKTYYLRYLDQRGRTRQIKLADQRDVTLAQARALADNLRNKDAVREDTNSQKTITRSTPTLAEFFHQKYLPFVKGYKRSWEYDESLFRNHINTKLGGKFLDEITKEDISSLHQQRRLAGAAPASANRVLVVIRYMLNLAIRWGTPGLVKNPTIDVTPFEENNKRDRFLSNEEAVRLYHYVKLSDNKMLHYIVAMLILTGARKREVLDAKWEDFDLIHQSWRIPKTKSGKPRHVPISNGVLVLLNTIPHIDKCPFVFPNPKTGIPFVTIFVSWNNARKQAGLAEVRIHDLRHSFASFLVNNGRSLYEVQKILGHTQIKTTQRYAHLAQETLIDAANTVTPSLGDAFTPMVSQVSESNLLTSNPKCGKVP